MPSRTSSSFPPENNHTNESQPNRIRVSGINIEWKPEKGICTFEKFPVAMMWVDTTLAGLFSGVRAMVGTERYLLALQSEGRKSVEEDWQVISQFDTFKEGFAAIANIAAVAGWGEWRLVSIDEQKKECCFRIADSWEGRYQKSVGVKWGSGMLAGKMAGYCSKLFGANCWADQTASIAGGDPYDEFIVKPSNRLLEKEIENLLATDNATRADMAVALKTLKDEIEERKRAEKNLRESEQRCRALIETTQTGYVILDVAGKVIDANPEYVRLTGHDHLDEIKGRSVVEWTADQDKEGNARAVAHCLRAGYIRNYTVHYAGGAGVITPIEINATVVGEGDSRRILTLCRDISDRLQAERMLQNAQKLESIGVLAGGIAHDFNNLLTGLFGFIEITRMKLPKGSEAQETLDETVSVFNRAKALTQQLLTFSKGGVLAKKKISILALLKEVVYFALSGSNIKPTFEIQEDLWLCDADQHQIGQVFDNIVINARQAMPLGGAIAISARNVNETETVPPPLSSGRFVKISVRDHGIGIPPDILPRIFDPFFTTKQEGSGLGLATAYSIVKKHDGYIYVESEPATGTIFTVYLPASPVGAATQASEEHMVLRGFNHTVLLMDDEDFILEIGGRFLRDMGCSVTAVSDGRQALECYAKALSDNGPFDLVILDLTIPGGMGGSRTMAELLRIDPSVTAIASSGYNDDPVMAFPQHYGFTAKLSKPYLRKAFQQVVGSVLASLNNNSPRTPENL